MKVLLLGKSGQVGWELQRSLAPLGELLRPDRHDAVHRADLADLESLVQTVRALKPQVIVNAAAHTAVDRAETEPGLARQLNAEAPAALAREAAVLNAWLVHFSTDYVFDGSGSHARDETAPTGPLGVYGRTKLEGEDAIRASGCRHLILRTSWVYAARGGNFARTMLRLAGERESLSVIADQFGAPTGAELLADVTAHLIHAAVKDPSVSGVYHLTASGETNWHAYATFVIDWARAQGLAIKVSPDAIASVDSAAYQTPARRPHNSRLSTAKIRGRFGLVLPPWQDGVERMLVEAFLRQGDRTPR